MQYLVSLCIDKVSLSMIVSILRNRSNKAASSVYQGTVFTKYKPSLTFGGEVILLTKIKRSQLHLFLSVFLNFSSQTRKVLGPCDSFHLGIPPEIPFSRPFIKVRENVEGITASTFIIFKDKPVSNLVLMHLSRENGQISYFSYFKKIPNYFYNKLINRNFRQESIFCFNKSIIMIINIK